MAETSVHDDPFIPHQEYVFFSEPAKQLLQSVGIDTHAIDQLSNSTALYHFLGTRLFDRGSRKSFERLELPDDVSNNKEVQAYYQNKLLPPLLILSSTALSLLKAKGYHHHLTFDVGNLNGANQVDAKPPGIIGDYLLRNVCAVVLAQTAGTSAKLVRSGGDEFTLVYKDDRNLPTFDQLSQEVSQDVRSLFKTADVSSSTKNVFQSAQITPKSKAPVSFEQKRFSEITTLDLQTRMENLKKHHPETVVLVDDINQLPNEEHKKLLIGLVEDILFDPLIQPHAENFNQMLSQQGKNTAFHIFRDRTDTVQHLQKSGGAYVLIRAATPGVLKMLNSADPDEYKTGSQFIVDEFTDIASAALTVDGRINFLRTGGDFYLVIPSSTENVDQYLRSIEQQKTHPRVKTADEKREFPIIRGAVAETITLTPGGPLNYSVLRANERVVEQTLEKLEEKMWIRCKEQFRDYYINSNIATTEDWHFLADFLNPHDKRGILRLNRYTVTPNMVSELSTFYTQSSDQEWQFDMAKLEAFKKAIKKILCEA